MISAVLDDPFPQIWQSLTADRLASLLLPLSPKVRNRVVSFNCPNCGQSEAWIYEPKDGKGPSLHCNRKNNCGHTVSLWEFVKSQHGGDGKAALAELADVTGVRMEKGAQVRTRRRVLRSALKPLAPPPPPIDAAQAVALNEQQAAFVLALPGSKAQEYLKRRGAIRPELPAELGFGFATSGPLTGRLTYPLRDKTGQIAAIEGRTLSDAVTPKCRCDGEKEAGVFFAGDTLRRRDLHLCEGVMDAVALMALGLNAVALCGGGLPVWLARLCAFQTVTLAFDADKAGDDTAARWRAAVEARGAKVERLRPPDEGKDWGDYLALGLPALKDAFWRAQGVSEAVCSLRAALTRLHERIVALRLAAPPKGSSASGVKWLRQQADALTALAQDAGLLLTDGDGLPVGYTDEDDPCADDSLSALWSELNELKDGLRAGLYPAPWPDGIDLADSSTVFAAGRLLNGKYQPSCLIRGHQDEVDGQT